MTNETTNWTTDEVNAKATEVWAAIERLRTIKHTVAFMIDDCPLGMAAAFAALAHAKATLLLVKEEIGC